MIESNNTTNERTPPTLMHVVGLLFLAGWVSVARALGEGRRTAAETLRVLRDWYAGYEALSTSDAACVEALEAIVGEQREVDAAQAPPADALVESEPTALDAVAGMLLRHGLDGWANALIRGALPTDAAKQLGPASPVDGVRREQAACIAALEALARGGLRPTESLGLLVDIARANKARDEAEAEAAALREERDRIQREWEEQGARLHEIESRAAPQVSEVVEAIIDVVTDYVDVPDAKMPKMRRQLQDRLREERLAVAATASPLRPAEDIARDAETPAPNELAQATTALTEARAKCDELRDVVRAQESERDAMSDEIEEVRSDLRAVQATLDEALRVQGAIWDAVGGQRDGESLVDAVRRMVRLATDPGPRAEVFASARYASYVTESDRAAPTAAHPVADAIAGFALDDIAALSAAGWVMRWTAPSMRWVTPGGAALDPATWRETLRREAARLTGKRYVVGVEGVVMEEAKMGNVVGGAVVEAERARLERSIETLAVPCVVQVDSRDMKRALDEAREAGRAEMRTERDAMQAQLDDARWMLGAHANETLFGAATRVSSDLTATRAERDTAYQRGQEEMHGRCARAMEPVNIFWSTQIRSIPLAKAPTVSASEVTGEAIPVARATETAGAGESVARGVDLATIWKGRAGGYRTKALNEADANKRGYHDGVADAYATCAGEVRAWRSDEAAEIARLRRQVDRLDNRASNAVNEIERWQQVTDCTTPEQAEEERIDLRLRCKNAEETETVVRADRDAAAQEIVKQRVEIERLNRSLRDSMERLAKESEAWRAAIGCETPEKARAFVARVNEAAKLLRD